MKLQDSFKEHWLRKHFVAPGQMVLLAVSGGADSMAMAHLFRDADISFGVAHCNFGLRGGDSDMDEQLVRHWCEHNGVPFHHVLFETKKRSAEWKKGTQETARILRYEWFETIRAEYKYARIATAHHANDNVETLFINLFKGTGIGGIHGILPENGYIIRPLLFATREMIMAYVNGNNISYREDASNATDDYLRNAVRRNIIPAVQEWFPNAVTSVNDSISRFAEAELLYNRAIEQERKKLLEQRGNDHYLPILKLKQREPLTTILYELLQPFGFSAKQVPHIINLMDAESGHYVLSDTHRIIRNRDFLVITGIPTESADVVVIDAVPCVVRSGRYTYSFSLQPKSDKIPADPAIACLDMKDITLPVLLRTWRTGDYFYPFGMKMKKKKVSRLLVDEKVALHEKEEIRILECGKRIAWVSGIRPDERFRVKDSTTEVLMVKRTLNQ